MGGKLWISNDLTGTLETAIVPGGYFASLRVSGVSGMPDAGGVVKVIRPSDGYWEAFAYAWWEMDGATWVLFLGFQGAAVARIAGDLPLPLPHGHLYLLAAVIWLTCFIPWFLKYVPLYWRPRADGQAG